MDSQVEFWQNLEKKRVTDHDFPPPFIKCGVGKKNKVCCSVKILISESHSCKMLERMNKMCQNVIHFFIGNFHGLHALYK